MNNAMLKPIIALFGVTLIASFLLGVVYTVTEKPIAEQKAKTEMEAVAILMAGTVNTESSEPAETAVDFPAISKITECFDGNGSTVGYVLSVAPKGYGGAIEMMVGIDQAGTVQGVQIISHSETPGLGANASEPEFLGQYNGKLGDSLTVVKVPPSDENEIEAIASATITSQAVTDGVTEAWSYFMSFILPQEAGAVQ